jgi:hypothetical protein
MLDVILIFLFVSQSLIYSNFLFRLNKPPFLNSNEIQVIFMALQDCFLSQEQRLRHC